MVPEAGNPIWSAMERLAKRGDAPWQLRLAEYLVRGGRVSRLEIHPRYRSTAEKIADSLPDLAGSASVAWASVSHPKIRLALSSKVEAFTQLPHLLALGPDGSAVGALVGGDVYVSTPWRGHGLGAELLLARAVLHDRGRQEGTLYSPEGHAAAVASHRMAIDMAVARHVKVRPAVLADHPGRSQGADPPEPDEPPAPGP